MSLLMNKNNNNNKIAQWLKYKLESCWRGYINVKNKYFGKLKYKKKTSIQQKIQDCKNDTKKLHRLPAYLFNLYCSTLNDIVPSDLHLSGFADDHAVRKEFKVNDRNAELQTKEEIKECMVNIRQWMDQVRLKMNSVKTELIYFGSKVQLGKCVVTHLNVNDEIVEQATTIKYLAAWLDAQLTFKEHTTKNVRQQ